MTFRILAVCTGNICRSPLAEQLLRRELADVDTVIASAGSRGLVGYPMDDRAAAYSRELGGDPDGHRARQLEADMVRESDLVLAASREHRRAAVELLPKAARRTFTLREFARLLETFNADDRAEVASRVDADAQLATLVELAASNRGVAVPPENAADDDIVDPYRREDAVYAAAVALLVPPIRSLGAVFRRAVTGFA